MDCRACFWLLQILLLVCLDRYHVLRLLMLRPSYDGERTLTDLKADLEISQVERLLLGLFFPPTIYWVVSN